MIVGNGSLYVAGSAGVNGSFGNGQWRIERRNLSNGALVSTFGSSGAVSSNPSSLDWEEPRDMAADTSFLYVVGYDGNASGTYPYQWRIEKRSLFSGALAGNFGIGGVVLSNPTSGHDFANAIALDATSMYVVGRDEEGWRIEKRLLSNGALVAGFGTGGVITRAEGEPYAVTIAGGYLYVGGTNDSDNWRLEKRSLSDGALAYAVVETFPSVGCGAQGPYALAVDGAYLYLVGDAAGQWQIEKRNLSDGTIVFTEALPGTGSCDGAKSLVVSGAEMYVSGKYGYEGRSEKRNLSDGSLVASFGTGGAIAGGFSYHGGVTGALASPFLYTAGTDLINGADYRWQIDKRVLTTGAGCWPP